MTMHHINLCLALLSLRDLRLRCGLHPINGAMPLPGVFERMEN